MIEIGQNPEGRAGINKFLSQTGEGHRGVIIAINTNCTEAILVSLTMDIRKAAVMVKWGGIYHVREKNPDEWPVVISKADAIPKSMDWKLSRNIQAYGVP